MGELQLGYRVHTYEVHTLVSRTHATTKTALERLHKQCKKDARRSELFCNVLRMTAGQREPLHQ